MENFKDPLFKTRYMKNKRRVKLWENDFMEKYGRKPNKNDMKEASVSVNKAYKEYREMKMNMLLEMLGDEVFGDDIQYNVKNNSPKKSEKDQRHDKTLNLENIMSETENIDPQNDKSFAEEQVPKKRQSLLIGKHSSFQLKKHKFDRSTFAIRNLKKPLSSRKKKNESENNWSNSNIQERGNLDAVNPVFNTVNRIVTFEENKSVSYSINNVQQSVNDGIKGVNRNLNEGSFDRCARDNSVEMQASKLRLSNISDSKLESMKSSFHSLKDLAIATHSTSSVQISDSDDYISDSEEERQQERENKRLRNFKIRFNNRDGCSAAKRPRN